MFHVEHLAFFIEICGLHGVFFVSNKGVCAR
jgi:hypothetical protein